MAIIVQKFGGTSLATVKLIKDAASRVKAEYEAGNDVLVVLSAMGKLTDTLVGYVREMSTGYDPAEFDTIVSAGEQISVGLMAMALQSMGLKARSWLGWQIPITTNDLYGSATIEDIPIAQLQKSLESKEIPIIAGFQGVSSTQRITTLGRGGSDASAVALAAAVGAKRCDIYTDVEGVYTADPRCVAKAGKLDKIPYQEMLELSKQGANVLQRSSVELAMKHGVPLRVLSSQSSATGTLITKEFSQPKSEIKGVVKCDALSRITLTNIPISHLSKIKDELERLETSLEMPRRILSPCGQLFDYSFVLSDDSRASVTTLLSSLKDRIEYKSTEIDDNLSKISVVGPSLSENLSLSQKLFHTLSKQGIQVQDVSTSDINISVLIRENETNEALCALHTAYDLDIRDS